MKTVLSVTGVSDAVQVLPSEIALRIRDGLLSSAQQIVGVEDPDTCVAAAALLKEIGQFLSTIEADRTTVKAPFIDYGKRIDATAKEIASTLADEQKRFRRMIGDFEAIQARKRQKAEEEARAAEAEARRKFEEEQAAAAAKYKTPAALERATVKAEEKLIERIVDARVEVAAIAPKVAGLSLRTDYDIEVTDIAALWMHSPECVEMKPIISAIKAKAKAGIVMDGVTWTKVQTSSIR